jgi:hypothetical protein
MGFFSRVKNAAVSGIAAIGKVKDKVDQGIQMYDKAKQTYNDIKNVAAGIPGASGVIAKAEAKTNAAIKAKTGVDIKTVNKAVNIGRQVSNETGNVLGVVGNVIR